MAMPMRWPSRAGSTGGEVPHRWLWEDDQLAPVPFCSSGGFGTHHRWPAMAILSAAMEMTVRRCSDDQGGDSLCRGESAMAVVMPRRRRNKMEESGSCQRHGGSVEQRHSGALRWPKIEEGRGAGGGGLSRCRRLGRGSRAPCASGDGRAGQLCHRTL
jgi:hypothetical protein